MKELKEYERYIIYGLFLILLISVVWLINSKSNEQGHIFDQIGSEEQPELTIPTGFREEWLEVYITHKVKQFTDLYAQRIGVQVAIVSEAKEIVITLTSANEQEEMSQTAKKIYADEVEKIVKSILKKYDWTKNHKLTIQYI